MKYAWEVEQARPYLTSKRLEFILAEIPLRQGAGTIPPEISYLIDQALPKGYRCSPENRIISERKKAKLHEEYKLKRAGENIEPRILYGSVARGEATEDSDVDVLPLSVFKTQRMSLFTQIEILGAEDAEKSRIYDEIKQEQESALLDFMKRYGNEIVSSVDALLDFIEPINLRTDNKGTTRDIEEALLVRSNVAGFLETLGRLVDKGKLRRYGFHQYQLVNEQFTEDFLLKNV